MPLVPFRDAPSSPVGHRPATLAALLGLALLASACNAIVSFDRRLIPKDAGMDAAARSDGGVDAGAPRDAGPTDAGRPDAGRRDAGRLGSDAGPLDAGLLCDPLTHAGCEGLCCDGRCIATSASACTGCGVGCDPVGADGCAGRTCRCGAGPACAGASPLCIEGGCVACRDASQCGGRPCLGGACAECDPRDHAGCGDEAPICDAGRCVPCRGDAECSLSLGGPICDEGRCAPCDPRRRRGCGGATPVCDPERLRCVACTPAEDRCRSIGRGFRCDPDVLRCVCVDPGRGERDCRCGGEDGERCEVGELCDLAEGECEG